MDNNQRAVEEALHDLLVVLMEELLLLGVGYGEVSKHIKQALVAAACRRQESATRPTVCHIATITGLDRHDVQRILKANGEAQPPAGLGYRPGRVARRWREDPRYNSQGLAQPPDLPMNGAGGFRELVESCMGDVTWWSVRVAMEDAGLVRIEKRDGAEWAVAQERRLRSIDGEALHAALRRMREVLD